MSKGTSKMVPLFFVWLSIRIDIYTQLLCLKNIVQRLYHVSIMRWRRTS